MNLDYETLKKEFFHHLEQEGSLVLATASDQHVTARMISHIILDEAIYFQTDQTFEKVKQIKINPNVALCVGNIQIEGTAILLGHPFTCPPFLEKFSRVHTDSKEQYSKMKDEVVIKVDPKKVVFWKYEDGKPLRDFLNLETQTAYRKYYDTTNSVEMNK